MPWFRTITRSRNSRYPPIGREVSRSTFEAADREAAVAMARERATSLAKNHFVALFDLDGNHLESVERPEN
jgi:hypothetical protein